MALLSKPHTLTLVEGVENIDGGGVVESTDHEVASTRLRGQLTPMRASSAFEKYGVEVNAPHELFFELPDLPLVKVGNRFTRSGRTFAVRVVPHIWDAESTTSHGHALLEEITV